MPCSPAIVRTASRSQTAAILRQKNADRAGSLRKTQVKTIGKAPENLRHIVGFGSAAPSIEKVRAAKNMREGLGSILDQIKSSVDCPVWNMDVIEQVRWNMQGPISDEAVGASFGAEIDLFGSGRSVNGVDYVETTMRQTGQTQTYMVTCYIGFHLEPEPLCWTAQGNAWTHPVSPSQQPPSPDVFTQNDRVNGALGAAVADGDQIFVPAVLEWGWWANYAFWHMARAYNLRWKIGQHTNIMDEILRHTAYTPPSAQEGSASSSEVDIVDFVNRLNTRYDEQGSALDFLKVNFTRLGSIQITSGETTTNNGVFRPDRTQELVGATYGGMDLRSLLKNRSEFRQLALPYINKPGVPIGLFLQENDSVQANIMRNYLSITQGFGVTPPLISDDVNISGLTLGGSGNVALERTLDGTNVPQQVDSEVALFKGGELKMTLLVKGFEVTEDWYNVLSSNADIRQVVMSECGVKFAMQGAAA